VGFEIVGEVTAIEVIAAGKKLRRMRELRERYGKGRWRKLKGIAKVRLPSDTIHTAEIHWYEAHGVGRRALKIKRSRLSVLHARPSLFASMPMATMTCRFDESTKSCRIWLRRVATSSA
jgi:hypothetical protein